MAETEDTMFVDNDQPIALRRTRRSCGPAELYPLSNSRSPLPRTSTLTTPRRGRPRKARVSDPGPIFSASPSGLTPFIRKTSLGSSKSKRRKSAPVRLLTRPEPNEPISGELQFAPLRQVLDGRVKRRMKRNRLSEEVNKIEWQKRHEAKARRSEVHRLRKELEQKDVEIQHIRDEQELASQFGFECGTTLQVDKVWARLQEKEREIEHLKAELSQKEERSHSQQDWTVATQDPFGFDDDDEDIDMLQDHGDTNNDDFNIGITIHSSPEKPRITTNYDDAFAESNGITDLPTQLNSSFPSPPPTIADLQSAGKRLSSTSTSTQDSFPDTLPNNLEAQLLTLQAEIKTLTAALARNKDNESRLSHKLSSYLPLDHSNDKSLDAALDSVLTSLTLAQSRVLEKEATFNALSNGVISLGFSGSPEEAIKSIARQFRTARLELEYLTPGENTEGFENEKLLEMLIGRLKHLVEKTQKQEATIDQYHAQEVLLRQQLSTRIDALHDVQRELSDVIAVVQRMSKEVEDNEVSNSRLQSALEGYRREVSSLERLIERIEQEHTSVEEDLHRGLRNLDDQLQHEILQHETLAAQMEGKDMLVQELEKRLTIALKTSSSLQKILREKESELERTRGGNLYKDEKIVSLRNDLDRTCSVLRNTQKTLEVLRDENSTLRNENEELEGMAEVLKGMVRREKDRGKRVVAGMRRELVGVLDRGRRFVESEEGESASETEGDSASEMEGPCTSETEAGDSFEVKMMERETEKEKAKGKKTIVKRGTYFDSGYARRKSGGATGSPEKKKKKRRYDSGLGFLEEDDQDMDEVGDDETESIAV
ncbi:hypothetical protein ACMFMG_005195 [Clarireedia jacksonii]